MRTFYFIILTTISLSSFYQTKSPKEIVQKNLDYYNQRDLEGFSSLLANDVVLFEFSKTHPTAKGFNEVKGIYKKLFDNSPKLHSTLINRITIGNKVIDHEKIVGRNGMKEVLELVVIYEVNNQKISKLTIIRK